MGVFVRHVDTDNVCDVVINCRSAVLVIIVVYRSVVPGFCLKQSALCKTSYSSYLCALEDA